MIADGQGSRASGATTEAVAIFDQAVRELDVYRGDPLTSADRANAGAPGFAWPT